MDIAVDIGGTFTDLVVRDGRGHVRGYKSLTTPESLSGGVLAGLRQMAADRGVDLTDLLHSTARFSLGTTVATNAILENRAARTGLLVTKGFRDTLLIGEGGKEDTYNIAQPYPLPYVPRELTFEVEERGTADGRTHVPLDEGSVLAAIEQCRSRRVRAVAVSLLWSIANPAHEQRIGELLREQLPGVPFSLSHRVNPCLREYRRTSATVLDASLKPIVNREIERIEKQLGEHGFAGTLSFVTSNGGRTSAREIVDKPVSLCFSGPSAAPLAGRRVVELEQLIGANAITIDMGGTSFDVSIVTGGEIPVHREGRIAGHVFGVPSVEVHTIGAGGGSLARVDSGGFVHVGPESAGALPGPACYGRGGVRPTVTDANLVCGTLGSSLGPGGVVRLSLERAAEAIGRHIAAPLGVSERQAAALVNLSCEQNMVGAIEDLTVKRGVDPREYVMVAGGAAAGLHAVGIARELDIRRVVIPVMGGVLSAFGISISDISFDFGRSHFTASDRFDYAAVGNLLETLKAEATAYLERMKVAKEDRLLLCTCEARYRGQVWQLSLPVPALSVANNEEREELVERFHRLHEKLYSVRSEADAVEITEWNVQAIGRLAEARMSPPQPDTGGRSPRPVSYRRTYLRELRAQSEVPVYDAAALAVDCEVPGPALVESSLGTIFVNPDATLRVSQLGNFIIDVR